MVLWAGFPYVFQGALLAGFVALAVLSWGRTAPDGVSDKLYAKTHLTQLLIWGLWWPGMVWAAVLLGRVWCAVCPLELVANVGERAGRRLGVRQRRLGRWLASGALIVGIYAAIQMLVAGMHLHRVPAYTAVFLVTMLGGAAVVGLSWRDRAFCRGFCPVGLLLATYGRGGVVAVRNGDATACTTCAGRDCVVARNRHRWQGPSCPSLLNPARLDVSEDCLLCGHCLKACEPDVMELQLRAPFLAADARERMAPWPVVLFVMLVSGFVAYELCTEWHAAKAVFLWTPQHVATWLGLDAGNGWVKGAWTLAAMPAALWLVLGGMAVATGGARTLGEAWRRLALPVVVVVAAGHMAKGLAKISTWGGFLPGAGADPDGAETALALTAGTQAAPAALFSPVTVVAVSLALLVAGTAFGIREARLADPANGGRLAPVILAVGAAAAVVVLGWVS